MKLTKTLEKLLEKRAKIDEEIRVIIGSLTASLTPVGSPNGTKTQVPCPVCKSRSYKVLGMHISAAHPKEWAKHPEWHHKGKK